MKIDGTCTAGTVFRGHPWDVLSSFDATYMPRHESRLEKSTVSQLDAPRPKTYTDDCRAKGSASKWKAILKVKSACWHSRRRDVEPELEAGEALAPVVSEPSRPDQQDVAMPMDTSGESTSEKRGPGTVTDDEECARLRRKVEGKRGQNHDTGDSLRVHNLSQISKATLRRRHRQFLQLVQL